MQHCAIIEYKLQYFVHCFSSSVTSAHHLQTLLTCALELNFRACSRLEELLHEPNTDCSSYRIAKRGVLKGKTDRYSLEALAEQFFQLFGGLSVSLELRHIRRVA